MNDSRFRDQFGFTPSDDFHLFWEFARTINSQTPQYALNPITTISLVGPYDLLSGRFDNEVARYDPCLHWRFFGDTPEFVTIMTGGSDGLHWGYVTQDPSKPPLGIAGYYAYDDVSLFPEPASLFDVLGNVIESTLEQIREDAEHDPASSEDEHTQEHAAMCRQLLDAMDAFCSLNGPMPQPTVDLELIEHSNPPPPFALPKPDDFDKLSDVIDEGVAALTNSGVSENQARLRVGRLLWHWHNDGNPMLEEAAFELLDAAYAGQQSEFLRHVLRQHRQHRHRPSLDVFES